MEGVDYSTSRPNLDQLWNDPRKFRFVCRYLAYLPNKKVLLKPELQALHAKGFGVVLNWEQATGDMLQGYAKGEAHAQEAKKQADALGAPASVPIYFSCDVDTTSDAQRAAVGRYLDGAASVLGKSRVGVYGEYEVIEALVPTKATWGWQTYAWSGAKTSAKAHFKQYQNGVAVAGADCDLDRSLQPNFGAWFLGGSTDMLLDKEQWQPLANTHDRVWQMVSTDVPALKTQLSAMNTTIQSMLHLLQTSGGNIDTAAVLTKMNELAQQELDRDNELKKENETLRRSLAAALSQ